MSTQPQQATFAATGATVNTASSQPTEKPPMTTAAAGAGTVPPTYDEHHSHNQVNPGQEREWSTGLCSCGNDVGGFALSCCCPCIRYGENKQRNKALRSGHALQPDQVESFGSDSVLFAAIHCCTGFGFILDFMLRSDIRERYNIKGSAAADCCTSWCCLPCSIEQQYRELEVEEKTIWQSQQPGAQPQMMAPPQQQQQQASHQV